VSYLTEISRSVVRYDPAHKDALRAFQRKYFGEAARHGDDDFADWLFERNPHRDPAGPSLWLCLRDGRVVGQQASVPIVIKVGARERRAAWLIDWMIDPAWRLRGVSVALLNANAASNDLMLGLGLEDVAHKTVAKAGWTDVGKLSLFVRPLDTHACARAMGLPAFVAAVMPPLLAGGTARLAGRVAGLVSGLAMEPVAAFDERIDSIWSMASGDYNVLVKRDYQTVRWRYDESPWRARYARYYFSYKGRTVGYAVLRLAQRRGELFGRVIDYLLPRKWTAPALALMLEALNAKGAVAVIFEHHQSGSALALRGLGCIRASESHRLMFKLQDGDVAAAGALARWGDWFVTPGDSDLDLVLADCDYGMAEPSVSGGCLAAAPSATAHSDPPPGSRHDKAPV
jgi:hypothetical protein